MNKKTIKIGGKTFALVAKDYRAKINKKAREQANRGYTYRIFPAGRQAYLYIGPRRKRRRAPKRRRIKR